MLSQTTVTDIKGSTFLFKLNIKLFKYLKVFAYLTPIKSNFNAFKKFDIKNIFYLPFVYPSNDFVSKKEIGEEIKIISIGKFQKRKDQLLLLKSFNTLVKKGYRIKLCLIGELADKNYFAILSNFIQENSLLKKVCIKTNISYSEIIKEYSKYDVFVLPAYDEPAAYSPVEAFANGLPVVCSDKNGTKCYIDNNKNGFIFEAKNQINLTEKLILCISDKNKLFEMQKNALLSAKENHNPEIFAKKILEILQKKN